MKVLGVKGFELIKDFEKLFLVSYPDQTKIWTIGWGTTRINGYPVKEGMVINEPVADALFLGDIDSTVYDVNKLLKVELNQNQFDSLVSLAYNIGSGGLGKSSLLNRINLGKTIIGDYFFRWNKVTDPLTGKKYVSNGLTRRRHAEYALFKLPVTE